jgi:hypothetical protein
LCWAGWPIGCCRCESRKEEGKGIGIGVLYGCPIGCCRWTLEKGKKGRVEGVKRVAGGSGLAGAIIQYKITGMGLREGHGKYEGMRGECGVWRIG